MTALRTVAVIFSICFLNFIESTPFCFFIKIPYYILYHILCKVSLFSIDKFKKLLTKMTGGQPFGFPPAERVFTL